MTRRSWIFMVALAALWGASYMFIKIALDDGVTTPSIVFVRVALGAAVLVPIALRWGALGGLRGHWGWTSAVAVAQVAAPFLLITYAEKWIPSSLAGILVSSTAIFVVLLAPWLGGADRVARWSLIGVLVGIVGVALLFGVDLSGTTKGILGGLMVLTASIGYAVASHWVRQHLHEVQPVAVAAGTLIVAGLISLPAAVASPPGEMPGLGTWAALLALGAGGTGIAFLLYYTLIAEIGAPRASVVAYLAPGFSVLYGALFLSEDITVATIFGLALILTGSWIGAEGRAPWDRRPAAGAAGPQAELAGDPLAEDIAACLPETPAAGRR